MTRSASGSQRRLAAIFCADVAGYTRLMNADERGTLRLLISRREITDRQIERHGGRIANTAGDSILAEFPSAVDAVQCALAIHELVAAANQDIPEERRIASMTSSSDTNRSYKTPIVSSWAYYVGGDIGLRRLRRLRQFTPKAHNRL
jgi:class 3 adenylate cyclase